MKKEMLALSVSIFMVFPLISGCLNIEKSYPEKQYFIPDISRHGNSSALKTDAVLRIRKFRVSPQYRGKGFIYRYDDINYKSDFYNEFFISPSGFLTEAVHQWLEDSNMFRHVIISSSRIEPTYTLEGSVTSLYGDYSDRAAPMSVLEIKFFLLREGPVNVETVFQNKYRKEIPIKNNSPEDLVKGWNKAIQQILTDFEEDLEKKVFKNED